MTSRRARGLSRLALALVAATAPGAAAAASAAAPIAATPLDQATGRVVDAVARDALARMTIPGLTVAVLRDESVFVQGYGTADQESGRPAGAETLYQIGSISKQFTAAGILRLAERGALGLDDPVSRHLPEYRPQGDAARIRHLLRQTSGIRELFTIPRYGEGIGDLQRQAAELVEIVEKEPLGFGPGSRWSYSNSNYTLLAAVIERLSGRPYEAFLAQELFAPLGLRSIHHCAPLPRGPDDARGHQLEQGRIVPSPPENMNWTRGDGGLCSTAGDLARWARALSGGQVLSAASYRQMTSSERLSDGTTPSYGFALSLVPLDGRRQRIAHNGAMAGFSGTLAHYPDAHLTIAVLANRGGLWPESIEKAIARRLLGMPEPQVRDVALTASERARYLGRYDIGVFAVRVGERGRRLFLEMPPPGPTSELLYQGDGRFLARDAPDAVQLSFSPATRRATRLRLLMAAMYWYGRRL